MSLSFHTLWNCKLAQEVKQRAISPNKQIPKKFPGFTRKIVFLHFFFKLFSLLNLYIEKLSKDQSVELKMAYTIRQHKLLIICFVSGNKQMTDEKNTDLFRFFITDRKTVAPAVDRCFQVWQTEQVIHVITVAATTPGAAH